MTTELFFFLREISQSLAAMSLAHATCNLIIHNVCEGWIISSWQSSQGERCCGLDVCLLVGCLTSQQHARVSQGLICSDNFTCCHTEIEVADQTFHLTQSQYTDTGPTSPSADPITPGTRQGNHWSADFKSLVGLDPDKIPAQAGFEPGIFRPGGGRLTTTPTRRSAWMAVHVRGFGRDLLYIISGV